jgi:hypothetical protein
MMRRDILLAAVTTEEFPATVEAAGTRLRLNGTATRFYSWLRIEVYRAALYLPAHASDAAAILDAEIPRLVEARYRRAVTLGSVVAAWEAALGAPLPPAFQAWLRPVAAGDAERQLFLADAVVLDGPGRAAQRVTAPPLPPPAARQLDRPRGRHRATPRPARPPIVTDHPHEHDHTPAGSPPAGSTSAAPALKFSDPGFTARGEPRAVVVPGTLRTLWINTGTLCNITCTNCYIESSPRNDALVYPRYAEVAPFLAEGRAMGATQVGFTGGEPFMNSHLPAMLRDVLEAGQEALVLTNAMKPMRRYADALLALHVVHGARLVLRVSLDHHDAALHDRERGAGSFAQAMEGIAWLARHGIPAEHRRPSRFGDEDEPGDALRLRAAVRRARDPARRCRSRRADAVP